MPTAGVFASFLHGGFECASPQFHGRQLDLQISTGHDRLALWDFETLYRYGFRTVRDGFVWHRIEVSPGVYDWSSALRLIHAARLTGIEVIWDLAHWGWPAHVDIWRPDFIERFTAYAVELAKLVRAHAQSETIPVFYCPMNESSFWSFAAGEIGMFAPVAPGRGFELKCQLVLAELAAIRAIRKIDPAARFVHADPIINVVAAPGDLSLDAEGHRQSQFQRWDMLAGRYWPLLGGSPDCLDIVGVNYYFNNQWEHGGAQIDHSDPRFRPLSEMLVDVAQRYGRPVYLAETGAEGDRRVGWLREIADELMLALSAGVDVQGCCLYPITDYPGWSDDRRCSTGLLGYPTMTDQRDVAYDYLREAQDQESRLGRQYAEVEMRRSDAGGR